MGASDLYYKIFIRWSIRVLGPRRLPDGLYHAQPRSHSHSNLPIPSNNKKLGLERIPHTSLLLHVVVFLVLGEFLAWIYPPMQFCGRFSHCLQGIRWSYFEQNVIIGTILICLEMSFSFPQTPETSHFFLLGMLINLTPTLTFSRSKE